MSHVSSILTPSGDSFNPMRFFVTAQTYETALTQQRAHYDQLLQQEKEHHAEMQDHLRELVKHAERERNRYRALWLETRGQVFEPPAEQPDAEPPSDKEMFEQLQQTWNEDERFIVADWAQDQIAMGATEDEIPGLYMKRFSMNSPLLELSK